VLGRMEDAADTFAALRLIRVGSDFSHRVLTDAAEGWTVTASPIAKMINAGNTIAKPIVFASIITSLARIRHEG
jgi:hypothetical protein